MGQESKIIRKKKAAKQSLLLVFIVMTTQITIDYDAGVSINFSFISEVAPILFIISTALNYVILGVKRRDGFKYGEAKPLKWWQTPVLWLGLPIVLYYLSLALITSAG